jgi:uncharacterized membrane protein
VLNPFPLVPSMHPPHSFHRLDALVDAVIAIAATLLVLDLRVPADVAPGHLGHALLDLWPKYLAYAFGFLQIASAWLALRRVSSTHTGVDHFGTLVVLVMLATTTLVPFTTGVLADVLHDSEDLGAATRLAGLVVLATSVLFAVLVAYLDRRGFVRPDLDAERLTALRRALPLLVLLPLVAVLVSYLSPWAGLTMIAVMLVLCLWPLDIHPAPVRPNG